MQLRTLMHTLLIGGALAALVVPLSGGVHGIEGRTDVRDRWYQRRAPTARHHP